MIFVGRRATKKKTPKKPDHVKSRAPVFGFDFSRMLLLYWIYDGSWQKWRQAGAAEITGLFRRYTVCWVDAICQSVLEQDTVPPFPLLFIKDFKSVMSPARPLQSLNITTAFWLCHPFIDFLLRGWWAAPFIPTVFISPPRRLSPHIKVKNQSRSVKLITSLLSARRNHASSDTTVAGSSGGRIIPEMSLFFFFLYSILRSSSRGFDWNRTPLFFFFFTCFSCLCSIQQKKKKKRK